MAEGDETPREDRGRAVDEGASERVDPPTGPIPQAGLLGHWIDKGGYLFAIGIFLAMLILIQEVILRYVFNSPTRWAHETTVFLSGIAFVYGGLFCAARDEHIRVVLLYDAVSPRIRRVFDIVISIVCAIASGCFAWASWEMVEKAAFRPDGTFRLESSGSAWDPVYPGLMKIFLMLVLGLLTIQFLILAWNFMRGAR